MIIGRTQLNAEHVNYESSLSAKNYYYISHLSRQCIIDNSTTKLPVNLNKIIINNNWKVVTYDKLKTLNNKEYNNLMLNNSGFAELSSNGEYIIFYDSSKPITMQRFTIAHEIGHILLHHFHRPSQTMEKEANMFAARLLMPMSILYECKIKSPEDIAQLCNVSLISSKYRYDRFLIVKERKKFYTDRNEKILKKKFKPFIKSVLKNKKKL